MNCRVHELKYKNVVNIVDGAMLGCINDIEFDTCDAKIVSIVIYGKFKFFGLLGREDDIIIPWCDIKIIGEDTVLVRYKRREDTNQKITSFLPSFFK